jgi:hypothetical protein
MNAILNLTQHKATKDQLLAGLVDVTGGFLLQLIALLTFDSMPTSVFIREAATSIADIAVAHREYARALGEPPITSAMIGGAPYLMSALEDALIKVGIMPMYAFTLRVSSEAATADGGTHKVAVFQHRGFIVPESAAVLTRVPNTTLIQDSKLSVRVKNNLTDELGGKVTVDMLSKMSDNDLMRIANIGRKALAEIRNLTS